MPYYELRPEQRGAYSFMINNPKALLLGDPGIGKTGLALSMVRDQAMFNQYRWLIVAPLLVAETVWLKEIRKFTNFSGIRAAFLHGPKRETILAEDHDVFITSTDYTRCWLNDQDLSHIDGLIVDEIDKFKNHGTDRYKALKKLSERFSIRYGMTGTPASRSIADLYPQSYIVDRGGCLGKNVTAFRKRWFYRGGFKNKEYIPKPRAFDEITEALKPISYRIEKKTEDPTINQIRIQLPEDVQKIYSKARRKLKISFDGNSKIPAEAGAAYASMRQLCAGGFYDSEKEPTVVHTRKARALKDLASELQGKKMLCFYWFKFEKQIIQKEFAKSRIAFLDGDTKSGQTAKILHAWANDEYDFVFCQPASAGHGIDGLQHGCFHLCWLTLPDDLAKYEQGNGRVAGNRAEGHITIHHIMVDNSVDEKIFDGLQSKNLNQKSILAAML